MKSEKKIFNIIKYVVGIFILSLVMFGAGFFVRDTFFEDEDHIVEETQEPKEDILVRVYDGEIQYYEKGSWHKTSTVEEAVAKDPFAVAEREMGLYAEGDSVDIVRKEGIAPEDEEKKQNTYTGGNTVQGGGTTSTPTVTPSTNTGSGGGATETPPSTNTGSGGGATETPPSTEATPPADTGQGEGESTSGDGEDMWSGDIL